MEILKISFRCWHEGFNFFLIGICFDSSHVIMDFFHLFSSAFCFRFGTSSVSRETVYTLVSLIPCSDAKSQTKRVNRHVSPVGPTW